MRTAHAGYISNRSPVSAILYSGYMPVPVTRIALYKTPISQRLLAFLLALGKHSSAFRKSHPTTLADSRFQPAIPVSK